MTTFKIGDKVTSDYPNISGTVVGFGMPVMGIDVVMIEYATRTLDTLEPMVACEGRMVSHVIAAAQKAVA